MKLEERKMTWNKASSSVCAAGVAIILVISMLCGILSVADSTHIELNTYSETAVDGKNPDGTARNVYELVNDAVLQMASEKLEGKISAEELKKHLSVNDDWSADETARFKTGIAQGTGKKHDNPARYVVTYQTVSEAIREDGVFKSIGAFFRQFVLPSKKQVLEAVAESYREYYEEQHCLSPAILKRDISFIGDLDFFNRVEVIEDYAGDMSRFLTEKYDKYVDFVSPTLNMGFGDLADEVDKIIDIDMENYSAYIVEHAVSKAPDKLMTQFRYMRDMYEEEMIRKNAMAEINKKAVDIYDSRITKVVFIPALDGADEFYMNRTKVGIDYLIKDGEDNRVEARTAERNFEQYKYYIEKFEKSATTEEEAEKGEVMYDEIETKLLQIQEKGLALFEETNRNLQYEGIEIGHVYNDGFVGFAKTTIKMFVFLLMIGFLCWNAVSFAKQKRR